MMFLFSLLLFEQARYAVFGRPHVFREECIIISRTVASIEYGRLLLYNPQIRGSLCQIFRWQMMIFKSQRQKWIGLWSAYLKIRLLFLDVWQGCALIELLLFLGDFYMGCFHHGFVIIRVL
jgi:hypothetical protein